MKRTLLITLFLALATCVFAQEGEKSILPKVGYETDFKRFGIGVEGRYFVTDNIRLAPDVIIFLPKDKMTGLDINVNAHYVFRVQDPFSVYPLAGIAILNNRVASQTIDVLGEKLKTDSFSNTDFGFNIGAGGEYRIDSKSYLNAELKYTFSDLDFASFFIGYGINF